MVEFYFQIVFYLNYSRSTFNLNLNAWGILYYIGFF